MNSLASALTLFASVRYIHFYFVLVFPLTLCVQFVADKNSFVGVFRNVKLICAIQSPFSAWSSIKTNIQVFVGNKNVCEWRNN